MKSLIAAFALLIAAVSLSPRAEAVSVPYFHGQQMDLTDPGDLRADGDAAARREAGADMPGLPVWLFLAALGALALFRGTRPTAPGPGPDGASSGAG